MEIIKREEIVEKYCKKIISKMKNLYPEIVINEEDIKLFFLPHWI